VARCCSHTGLVGGAYLDELGINNDVVVVVDVVVDIALEGQWGPGVEGIGEGEGALLAAPVIDRLAGEWEALALCFNAAFVEVDQAEEQTGALANFALRRRGLEMAQGKAIAMPLGKHVDCQSGVRSLRGFPAASRAGSR
jgi:hypothetical protein